ncbi:hypothetical protein FNB15_07150 [Ferrovibrio terrae]|uniref:Uncharacterized protein n=1 Tax=Ferrovibrio terrae TaxID=2594003 RepID=A0A516GZV7_9PROT|nr:hypothetical protein [Ferrovibrio terrae]QDO97064.1 hypothetical protein FNB15_07150 [Ferrovibrio terrae]
MRDAVSATHVVSVLPSSVRHWTDGGMVGDLPLHVLLADEVMEAVLRSAGHTAATFLQQWRGFATVSSAGMAPAMAA